MRRPWSGPHQAAANSTPPLGRGAHRAMDYEYNNDREFSFEGLQDSGYHVLSAKKSRLHQELLAQYGSTRLDELLVDVDGIGLQMRNIQKEEAVSNLGMRRDESIASLLSLYDEHSLEEGGQAASGKLKLSQKSQADTLKYSKLAVEDDAGHIMLQSDWEWEYPGWGQVIEKAVDLEKEKTERQRHHPHQLDLYRAVAISGNDLLASVLYTTGIVCTVCHQLAPFAMLLACLALYPFIKIFQECGTAIPLNGGVYIALLNSASKFTATFAASCSLISYAATCVVSAASCTSYAYNAFGEFPVLPVTIGIMAFFGVLVFFGVKDSANVALLIFSFHLLTLLLLILCSLIKTFENGGSILYDNYTRPLASSNIGVELYLGYCVSLLGLTGFETSANFIEEAGPFDARDYGMQRPAAAAGLGASACASSADRVTSAAKSNPSAAPKKQRVVSVFEQTITSMWYLVILINPTIAILSLAVVPLDDIIANPSIILSQVAQNSGGSWLAYLVAIDAIMVLSGGVLTAYVGVNGLVKQLAADRCLPHFLLRTNKYTGSNQYIILCFFILCTTLYVMTSGDVIVLSGVFAIAFLMVLIMFAVCNLRLKFSRPSLPRAVQSSWAMCIVGLLAMAIGVVGNIYTNVSLLYFFLAYLAFFYIVIIVTFERSDIMKFVYYFVKKAPIVDRYIGSNMVQYLKKMKNHTVLFFCKTSGVHILNEALLYAKINELCDRIVICHVQTKQGDPTVKERLKENVVLLDHMYPKTKIDLLLVQAEEFSPLLIQVLSEDLNIPPSYVFIKVHPSKYSSLPLLFSYCCVCFVSARPKTATSTSASSRA